MKIFFEKSAAPLSILRKFFAVHNLLAVGLMSSEFYTGRGTKCVNESHKKGLKSANVNKLIIPDLQPPQQYSLPNIFHHYNLHVFSHFQCFKFLRVFSSRV